MDVKRRLGLLLAGTVVGTSILVSAPALSDEGQFAAAACDAAAIERPAGAVGGNQKQATAARRKRPTPNSRPTSLSNRRRAPASCEHSASSLAADVPVPTKVPPS
jgi:hypothetical protein